MLNTKKHRFFFITLWRWVFWGILIGLLVGTTSALLLETNDFVGNIRENTPWLLFLLPLGGVAMGLSSVTTARIPPRVIT